MENMATTISNPKFSGHARSISFPSASHPLIANAEEHLQRLKSSESLSSSSQASACKNLDGLKGLYDCLDDVLQLPLSQQVLSHERCNKWEEEVLDGSLRLLDICGSVKDIYLQKKESIQQLESSLRRKRGSGELSNEVEAFIICKRSLNKMISKCHKELRTAEKGCNLEMVNKASDTAALINLIKEVQRVSLKVFESALSLVSESKAGSQTKGWSLISKALQQKRASCNLDSDLQVDLQLLNGKKSYRDGDLLQMQNILKRLESLDICIQEVAEELEIVYRILLKTRVSLLNILNH